MARPRGTTFSIRFVNDDFRTLKWGVFWNVYEPGRLRPRPKATFFATEGDAQEFQQRTLAALADTTIPAPMVEIPRRAVNSLSAVADAWLTHVHDQREAATHRSYQGLVDHYLAPPPTHRRYPGLGDVIVSDATLTPKVIADFLTELHRGGVSLSMRRRVHRGLSSFCTYARFEGRLTGTNPCHDLGRLIRRKGEEDHAPTPNPFTQDEITRIFDQLEACEPDWLSYFQFLYDTGVRPGEAAALKWTAIDFERLKVQIELSWSPAAQADKLPKTHERRLIDLTDLAADRLLAWRPIQRQALLRRASQQTPYVFTSRRGARRFQDGNVRLVFARVMTACAITGHTLYDFRDSFASHHLSESWDRKLPWVSQQLGHKQVSTTAQYYYAYRPSPASRGFANEIRGGS